MTKKELESQLGIIYTELTGKTFKNTAKQLEEFSKYTGTPKYEEAKALVKKIMFAKS